MGREIITGQQSRTRLLAGVEKVANIVGSTMGPKGMNVIVARGGNSPIVTNDGVSVAKEVSLEDPIENIGAAMVIEAAEKTNTEVGDGTSTTTVLAHAICKEGMRYVSNGMNPFKLAEDLHDVKRFILDSLKAGARQISSFEDIKQVASLSAQDEEVGKIIAECFDAVGPDGIITVEEGMKPGLSKEIKTGMQFDQGLVSPYFVTDTERNECVMNDPYILVTDKKLTNMKDIVKILEVVMSEGSPLVIIADEIEGECLASLILNKMRGLVNVLPIKAPGVGLEKKAILFDIAAITGATVITEEAGLKLDMVTVKHLGKAKKVTSDKTSTTIVDGIGSKEDIEDRVRVVRKMIEETESFEKQMYENRLARLVGGVAIIKVGAATVMELKNKKYKIEDAIAATKAAVAEGVTIGGGVELMSIAKGVPDFADKNTSIARDILRNACEAPLILICNNAGYRGDYIVEKIKSDSIIEDNYGFNAKTGKYGDLFKMGIVDPVKVLRVSLENAVSTAIMLLTSNSIIYEEKKQEANSR